MKTHGKHFQTWDDVFHSDFKAENSVSLKYSVIKSWDRAPISSTELHCLAMKLLTNDT